jgi:3-isopropylmalate dehydratase small subunit
MCSLFWTLGVGTTSPGAMYKRSTSSEMKNHFSSTWTDYMQLSCWRVTGSILVRQKVTRSSLCCSVKAGFKADVHVIITGSFESHFIRNSVDFGILRAWARSRMVLLRKRWINLTASRTSSWFHFLCLSHFFFWGLERNWRMSGFS